MGGKTHTFPYIQDQEETYKMIHNCKLTAEKGEKKSFFPHIGPGRTKITL